MADTLTLRQCFAEVQDPRREHQRFHSLWDIIALTICAVIANADNWVEVEHYGRRKYEVLRQFLELPNGIPSHDTFGRVFSLIEPVAFQRCFGQWVEAIVAGSRGRLINIDGKTLCGSADKANGRGALHLVSAWVQANHLVLGQLAVADKSNEITAIPELVSLLNIKKAIITIDAMGCQKEIASTIIAGGGDYLLALKDNHPTLANDVTDLFCAGLENDFAELEHRSCQTEDDDHGRRETRHYHVVKAPEDLLQKHPHWEGLRTLVMVFSERQVGEAEPSAETRFYLSSLPLQVKKIAAAVRGHWGIENNLHWQMDVCFREDESRVRKDHAPANLALLRRLAASLLKQEEIAHGGTTCKRKQAGWDDDYLFTVLAGQLI